MKFWEAMKALEEGYKVRKVIWDPDIYIYLSENKVLWWDGDPYPCKYDFEKDWEICNKLTLDEAIVHLNETIESMECGPCKDEHKQLKEWLLELKSYKKDKGEN
jgi:hypothetical protein